MGNRTLFYPHLQQKNKNQTPSLAGAETPENQQNIDSPSWGLVTTNIKAVSRDVFFRGEGGTKVLTFERKVQNLVTGALLAEEDLFNVRANALSRISS